MSPKMNISQCYTRNNNLNIPIVVEKNIKKLTVILECLDFFPQKAVSNILQFSKKK